MTNHNDPSINSGSQWLRWEPHIHAPGTVLNDQFKGEDAFEQYLARIEGASPTIRAIGVTDYYMTDSYKRVAEAKRASGRLLNCDLIFSNIEMRLGVGTVKGQFLNIHLLVNPEDPRHLEELDRFLTGITFKYQDDEYRCTPQDLRRLGEHHDATLQTDEQKLRCGVEQFKVDFDQLKRLYDDRKWAQENILIGVAANSSDGTSGLGVGADAALRQKVEAFAHVIFASSDSQRLFWLGQRADSKEVIRRKYGGLKPCLHGSDAHTLAAVGKPDSDRFTWIKGEPSFDALRQANIDPENRAYVGAAPPQLALSSRVIEKIEIKGSWAKTPSIKLNPGLVAVIGARGSGKTALVDIIAKGCDATADTDKNASFLKRAEEVLGNASAVIGWQSGERVGFDLVGESDDPFAVQYPRARYLSQKFVEKLCSPEGEVTDTLMAEVKRVIFEAHDVSDRENTANFDEMLSFRANRFRQERKLGETAISSLSDSIAAEIEKENGIAAVEAEVMPSNLIPIIPAIVAAVAAITSIFCAYLSWQLKNLSDSQALKHALAKERREDLKDIYVKINVQFTTFAHANNKGKQIEPSDFFELNSKADLHLPPAIKAFYIEATKALIAWVESHSQERGKKPNLVIDALRAVTAEKYETYEKARRKFLDALKAEIQATV